MLEDWVSSTIASQMETFIRVMDVRHPMVGVHESRGLISARQYQLGHESTIVDCISNRLTYILSLVSLYRILTMKEDSTWKL